MLSWSYKNTNEHYYYLLLDLLPIQRQLTDKTKSQENAIISTQFIMKIITQHVKKKEKKNHQNSPLPHTG